MRPFYLAAIVLLLVGCSSPPEETVSVDLSKVKTTAWEKGMPETASYKPTPRPKAFKLPGLEAMEIVTPAKDVEEVKRLLAAQQAETERRLVKSLSALYARMARRDERRALGALTAREQSRYEAMNNKIRAIFDTYATNRMPRAARLAFLAGFPDPNPTSKPPEKPLGNVSGALFAEAKRLREEIATLDANFDAAVQSLSDELDLENLQDRTTTRVNIELNADELRQRAAKEAALQVRQAGSKLVLQLAGSRTIKLPAVPGRTVTPPPMAAPKTAPKVDSDLDQTSAGIQRRQLEGDLRIWAALKQYQVHAKGRDATEEFIRWRNENQAGL